MRFYSQVTFSSLKSFTCQEFTLQSLHASPFARWSLRRSFLVVQWVTIVEERVIFYSQGRGLRCRDQKLGLDADTPGPARSMVGTAQDSCADDACLAFSKIPRLGAGTYHALQ